MRNTKGIKRVVKATLFVIFAVAFVIAGSLLARNLLAARNEADQFKRLSQMTAVKAEASPQPKVSPLPSQPTPVPTILPQYEKVHELNSDIYGWLTVEGTKIDYPVMWTPEEPEFYLHKDFEKNYSFSGVPFIGEGFNIGTSNTIIYGHHMNDGSMFAGLMSYEDKAFYELHPKITFNTMYETGEYEVISVFRSQVYYWGGDENFIYYDYTNIDTKKRFEKYVEQCKAVSIYDIDATAEWGDKLITLSTCAYHVSDGRFVVVAKKI